MRAEFEAWARPLWRHREDFDQRTGAAPGTYNNYEVQAAWVAWQEATKIEREACAKDCETFAWQHPSASMLGPEQNRLGCAALIRSRSNA